MLSVKYFLESEQFLPIQVVAIKVNKKITTTPIISQTIITKAFTS